MAISVTGVKQIFSLDLRSLAFYRMLLGVVLLADTINRILLVPAFYSDSGIVPRALLELVNYKHAYHFQLLMLNGENWFVYAFLGTLILLSLFLIAGYKTKTVTFLCWVFLCSLYVRNPLILDSQDVLLVLLLFWGIFLPLGRLISVDAYKKKKSFSNIGNYRLISAATIGLYIQFVLLYIMNGMYKGQYLPWVDGTHLYNTLSRFEFVKPLAFVIYPYYDLLSFLTKFSLYLELFGPLLFFIPIGFYFLRMAGIILFLGLQISIFLTLDIGLFPLVSISAILVFLPTEFWNRFQEMTLGKSTGSKIISEEKVEYNANLISELFIGFLTVYIIVWNIAEYSSREGLPEAFKMPGYFLKVDQKWALFSSPQKKSIYLSVQAKYEDNSTLDLIQDLKTPSIAINEMRYVSYNNYRWRLFLTKHVGDSDQIKFMPYFINYLVDQYGYNEASGKTLDRVDIIPHMHYIGERYNLTPLQTDIIYTLKFNE